jgi:uncharacterized membrane protein YciS (DUF1049 family)
MKNLGRRKLFLVAVVAELVIALGVYIWCIAQGSCSGECVAAGYVVAQTCLGLALKTLAALLLATGVAYFLTRK